MCTLNFCTYLQRLGHKHSQTYLFQATAHTWSSKCSEDTPIILRSGAALGSISRLRVAWKEAGFFRLERNGANEPWGALGGAVDWGGRARWQEGSAAVNWMGSWLYPALVHLKEEGGDQPQSLGRGGSLRGAAS